MLCIRTMRTDPPSLTEKNFIVEGFRNGVRADDRRLDDFRQAVVMLGGTPGTALCKLGRTKVLCAVSASIAEPSRSRPTKGIITVEVDMSPMASPANEAGKLGNKGLELTRLLEMVLRDSRCIDVEALCIRAKEEVWKIRIDVRVLDDDGSLVDCASLAAAAALQHYARPDVTVLPDTTTVHAAYDKALVPLNIYHMPFVVTVGISKEAGASLVDPSDRESLYLDGCLVIACNKRREICVLHQTTNLVLNTEQIMSCVRNAMERAVDLSELVAKVMADDARAKGRGEEGSSFETAQTAELLTSKEAHPNELIAVAISTAPAPTAPSIVVREENGLGEGGVEMDEEERQGVEEQVGAIVSQVGDVSLEKKAEEGADSAAPSGGRKRGKKGDRKAEAADLALLLDGIGEEEMMQLGGGERAKDTEEEQPAFDLTAAKKKKKK